MDIVECSASKIISNGTYHLLFILLVHKAKNKEIWGKAEERKKVKMKTVEIVGQLGVIKAAFFFIVLAHAFTNRAFRINATAQ